MASSSGQASLINSKRSALFTTNINGYAKIDFDIGFNFERNGRARWGASGALSLTIRYSGIEFPAEAVLFLDCVHVSGVEGMGPARRALCKPRQDREVAAVAEWFLVRQISLS